MLGFAGWKILADHFWVLCCILLEERQRLGSHCVRSCAGRDPCSSQEEHRQGSDGCRGGCSLKDCTCGDDCVGGTQLMTRWAGEKVHTAMQADTDRDSDQSPSQNPILRDLSLCTLPYPPHTPGRILSAPAHCSQVRMRLQKSTCPKMLRQQSLTQAVILTWLPSSLSGN